LTADQLVQAFSLKNTPAGFEGLGVYGQPVAVAGPSLEDLAIEDAYADFQDA
jgi:hypothetical protein